jgi:hypothetical protein
MFGSTGRGEVLRKIMFGTDTAHHESLNVSTQNTNKHGLAANEFDAPFAHCRCLQQAPLFGSGNRDYLNFTQSGTISLDTPVSATPLPATLPLFAGGLGFVGYLTRRRKRSGASALGAGRTATDNPNWRDRREAVFLLSADIGRMPNKQHAQLRPRGDVALPTDRRSDETRRRAQPAMARCAALIHRLVHKKCPDCLGEPGPEDASLRKPPSVRPRGVQTLRKSDRLANHIAAVIGCRPVKSRRA